MNTVTEMEKFDSVIYGIWHGLLGVSKKICSAKSAAKNVATLFESLKRSQGLKMFKLN